MSVVDATPAAAWQVRALTLAQWAQRRLVNRVDAYGQYKANGGQQTVSWEALDDVRLALHFSANGIKGRVAGIHTTALDDTCKWIATDHDQHSDDPAEDVARINLRDALRVADRMDSVGVRPLVEDSNGAGGFHVWGMFREPLPCEVAYRLARWCLQDCEGEHEAFPKQRSRHDTAKGFGNWLRIPGRHHKRSHWSRFYADSQWLEGAEAIAWLLSFTGSATNDIPVEARTFRTPAEVEADQKSLIAAEEAAQRRQEWQRRRDAGELQPHQWDGSYADQVRLAAEFAAQYPVSVSGQGGHNTAFALACSLRIGFDLSEQDTLSILVDWNRGCSPPWSDDELRHKAEQGSRGRGVRGELLTPPPAPQKTRKGIVCDDTTSTIPIETIARVESNISIEEWREGPMNAKLNSIGTPGVYFDGRPTGSGKTTGDLAAFASVDAEGGRSLLILPTHSNATEAEHDINQAGLDGVKYPERLTEDKTVVCPKCEGGRGDCELCGGSGQIDLPRNCWSPDADPAQALGLSVVSTVCPHCSFHESCQGSGYLGEMRAATEAAVSIATHARGAIQGIGKLSHSREFVSVHEDVIGLLRPSEDVTEADQRAVEVLADRLVREPRWLNYFGGGKTDEQRENRRDQKVFALHFVTVCEAVGSVWGRADETTPIHPVVPRAIPEGFTWTLYRAARDTKLKLTSPAFRVLLEHATGSLHSLSIVVGRRPRHGGDVEIIKTLVAVWDQRPPETKTVWFSDATGDADQISRLIGRAVTDVTPEGTPARVFPPLQVCHDICRTTSGKTIRAHLRFIMAQYPEARRVGVITHSTATSAVHKLREPFKSRINRVAYFREGPDRAPNAWYQHCDLLVVIGTPRVPPEAIRKHLTLLDKIDAAATAEPEWMPVRWRGERVDGASVTVETRGYRHPDWKSAHRNLVRADHVQAIGRGRALLADGIPTVAVSVDECGAVIAPASWHDGTISDSAGKVFEAMCGHEGPNGFGRKTLINLLEKSARIRIADRTLKGHLFDLRAAGLVTTTGAGKNTRWHVTPAWLSAPAEISLDDSTEGAICHV